jgi:hypothetical protein
MITHPPTWDTLLVSGGAFRPSVKVTAYRPYPGPGGVIVSTDIPVTAGRVTKDSATWPRTKVSLLTANMSLAPVLLSDALQPNGTWLAVDYGFTDPATDSTAYIRVADGPITRVAADRPGALLTIESADPSVIVAGNEVLDPLIPSTSIYPNWGLSPGSRAHVWLQSIVAGALSGTGTFPVVSSLTGTQQAITVPTDWTWKGDPWAAVEQLADLLGAEAFFDANRNLILRPTPTEGSPVFAFLTGERGNIIEYSSEQQRPVNRVRLVYNATVPGSAIVGQWYDSDPSSPTYLTGLLDSPTGYGIRSVIEEREGTPTQVQADAAAAAYALRLRGQSRTVDMRVIPVPWLEPGDTISTKPVGQAPETHLVQSLELPLVLDSMFISTRHPTYSGPM